MLYTASVLDLVKIQRKMKEYYIIEGYGNDVVAPDKKELDHYKNGIFSWAGLKMNYLAKIYKSEASEWMKNVSEKAAYEDIVLVDEEKDVNHSCRKLLAELMKNMYSGQLKFQYMGELIK